MIDSFRHEDLVSEWDFYYVGNIARDISGITRKSTAENPIGAADFLTKDKVIFCSLLFLYAAFIFVRLKF